MNISPNSPKQQWLADAETAQKWAEIVANPVFMKAMTYALAEFSTGHRTSEESQGANTFRAVLAELSERYETLQMPQKSLRER